ncbi:unnamed protein product [Rotaria sp. Silwood2]|nr:unnamed protein product [Rotaria sp. Silwood2]CAF2693120.1 unnamed protein product [Rotaria sp. Silwood2]CAF3088105.1 unnamed protein product [Rotaria sp. Silwood2]CAF4173530.1 unnamed protein product [Rotaria sp. Silwood2]CAF4193590.1 unnamed protein product [Rotaria sp. Silwood2]
MEADEYHLSLKAIDQLNQLNHDKTNDQQNTNCNSLFSRLYYQTIGIRIKPNTIVLDKDESYKKLHHDRLIKSFMYLCDLLTHHCLPSQLSSIIIPIPGLILHIALFIFVYLSTEISRLHYILWMIVEYFIYILDIIDGKQARRNGTQSLARHF